MIITDPEKMPITGKDRLALDILKILGLDGKGCKEFALKFAYGDIVTCEAVLMPTREQIRAIAKRLEPDAKKVIVNSTTIGDEFLQFERCEEPAIVEGN